MYQELTHTRTQFVELISIRKSCINLKKEAVIKDHNTILIVVENINDDDSEQLLVFK